MQEKVSNIATAEVNSSMMCVSDLLAICNDVITKRQNPNRFAEVFRICCEVLFAICQLLTTDDYLIVFKNWAAVITGNFAF